MHEDITKISIKEYLEGMGIPTRKEGARHFASSPFSTDSNWSFVIYPTNTYFDFSTGQGGNILNLVSRIRNISLRDAAHELRQGIRHEKFKPTHKQPEQQRSQAPFDYTKYINTDAEECAKIKAYAASRGIEEGYFCGVFFERNGTALAQGNVDGEGMGRKNRSSSNFTRVPALGFLHVDKDLKPCGIKLRRIDNKEPKFSARGKLGLYLCSDLILESQQLGQETLKSKLNLLFVVEGESNANSLMMHGKVVQSFWTTLSFGGVSKAPSRDDLPEQLKHLPIKLIIDYDGSEELYKERLKLYEDLKAEPIKLILPKGEDINFLYCRNEMWKIESLLL